MKKILILLNTIFLCFCFCIPFTTYADRSSDEIYDVAKDTQNMTYDLWNYINNSLYPAIQNSGSPLSQDDVNEIKNSMNSVQTKVNDIDVQRDIENYYNSLPEDDGTAKGYVLGFGQSILETAEDYWNSISVNIEKANKGIYKIPGMSRKSLNPADYVNDDTKNMAYNIFRNLGYSLVLLFFSMSLIENTIKLDAFSLKGGAMIFGRLIVSKVVIDLAGRACIAILDLCTKTCTQLAMVSASQLNMSGDNDIGSLFHKSDVKFVGGIIDVFTALGIVIPILIITIPILICSIVVLIKLVGRGLELTMLIIVSPAFFACYSSDVTKQYFKTFIVTFIQVALQVVFMMVVFYIGSAWLTQTVEVASYTSVFAWMLAMFPNLLFIIVITKMIVKPPRILMHLLHG